MSQPGPTPERAAASSSGSFLLLESRATTANMGRLDLMAATVLLALLLLCTETASYRLQKREAQDSFSQIQEAVKHYWERLNSAAQGWLDGIKSAGVEKKIRDIYEKTSSTAGTYTGILLDQLYHGWYGD